MSAARQGVKRQCHAIHFFRIFDIIQNFSEKGYLLRLIIADETINFSNPKPGINACKIMLLYKRQLLYLGLGDRGICVYILSVSTAYDNLVSFAAVFRDVTQRSPYDNRIYAIFETQKSTLVHGFTHQDYTPGGGNNLNYTSVEKKNVIKETAICERKVTSIRATFNLSQLASALKRDLCL